MQNPALCCSLWGGPAAGRTLRLAMGACTRPPPNSRGIGLALPRARSAAAGKADGGFTGAEGLGSGPWELPLAPARDGTGGRGAKRSRGTAGSAPAGQRAMGAQSELRQRCLIHSCGREQNQHKVDVRGDCGVPQPRSDAGCRRGRCGERDVSAGTAPGLRGACAHSAETPLDPSVHLPEFF